MTRALLILPNFWDPLCPPLSIASLKAFAEKAGHQVNITDLNTLGVVGRTVRETAPYRLLEALANYLERGRFIDFAALVRHPDLHQFLTQQVSSQQWLAELDDYYSEHLQPRLGTWLDESSESAPLQQVVAIIHELIEPLRGSARSLAQWAPVFAQLLTSFYGDRSFQVDLPRDLLVTFRTLCAVRGEEHRLVVERMIRGYVIQRMVEGAKR